ncbi:hypothetical protein Val02_61870 [Virgisporangium aliadipatigenens]|uniref:Uncharacterized protein n=1 Tax=Virgisporangium aliadipatigenens TaxID=741659 RepID=A0A8J4DTH5_9ACTN|nr:hypothetical protein [Virgisporangium aliadipatigenens]GIJ49301.1 hypothetical protein Val02_61870 [Virgisporangium aliadipatigenens]
MRCPHCRENLRRHERYGGSCDRCGREFALDPYSAPFRLNDLHLRAVARRLSHDGLLSFTSAQLYHAVQPPAAPVIPRPYVPPPPRPGPSVLGELLRMLATLAVTALGVLGFPAAAWVGRQGFFGAGTLATLLVGGFVLLVFFSGGAAVAYAGGAWKAFAERGLRPAPPPAPREHIRLPAVSLEVFRSNVLARWRHVYGSDLPGLCDDAPEPEWGVPPVLAVACPSPAIRACLYANGVPVRVVDHPRDAPEGTLVAQLHDVAASGFVLAHRRGAPDLTPGPGGRRDATWLRWRRSGPAADAMRDALGAVPGLAPRERDLLGKGWWCPAEAMPPAVLIRLVERHRRAIAARDPDHRAARDLGFLDMPHATDPA